MDSFTRADVFEFLLTVPAFLIGIGFHEWAHAWTAWRMGDDTPADQERLSLNPLDHLDPVGTLAIAYGALTGLPAVGWGKPVEVDPSRFRDPVRGDILVSLAGVTMNLTVAGLTTLLLWAFVIALTRFFHTPVGLPDWVDNVRKVLERIVAMNVGLAVFNLIPLPPLDGSHVLKRLVSADTAASLSSMDMVGSLLLMGLVLSNMTRFLAVPVGFLLRRLLADTPWFALGYTAVMGVLVWAFLRSLRRIGDPMR